MSLQKLWVTDPVVHPYPLWRHLMNRQSCDVWSRQWSKKAMVTSFSVKLVRNGKHNAENQLSLKKKKKSGANSISSELESLSLLWQEQIAKDKSYKLMQLSIEERKFSIEEHKFQAESEWEEWKMGMLEQELTIKMEKLKAETEREWLHVDKERLNMDKERLRLEKEQLKFKVDVLLIGPLILCCSSSSSSSVSVLSSIQSWGMAWSIKRLCKMQAHIIIWRITAKSHLLLITILSPCTCWNLALSIPMQCSLLIHSFTRFVLKYFWSSLKLAFWPFLKAGTITVDMENAESPSRYSLLLKTRFFWQVNITSQPNPVVVYTTRPSNLNQSNICNIITNKQTFNCIVIFLVKYSSESRVGAKAKGNKVPSIKPTQLTKPCACLIPPICFLSSLSKHNWQNHVFV